MEQVTIQEGTSADIVQQNIQQLQAIFPEAFTEGGVNFDVLRQLLGDAGVLDEGEEKFGFNWYGKKKARQIALTPSTGTLRPCPEESVDWDTTQNLFIEGDNLEVLKLLQKSYAGQVKMIYIDPPYNTGNEFIYPDNYQDNLDTYLRYTGQKTADGYRFSTNTESTGRYHTNWLNMMYPRLKLAQNLLRDDGAIFISIDDNEQSNLKKICDDIFGEENFIDTICWKKKYGGGAKEKYLVSVHEYILIYAKSKTSFPEILVDFDEQKARRFYKYKDDKFKTLGYYRTHPLEAVKSFDLRENLRFPVTAPDGTEVWPKRQWRWSRERFEEALAKDEVIFNKNKDDQWVLYSKQYLNEESGEQRKTKAQSLIDDIFTQEGTKEIYELFGDAKIFPFPKPINLAKKIIEISGICESDIALDFFAGSATLAVAVQQRNLENQTNCRCISVQLPELTDEKSESFNAGYINIADIGKERIRRAAKKIKEENPDYDGDLGFKVFKLDSSNIRAWDPDASDLEQTLLDHIEHLVPGRSEEDVLYELLLKRGVDLTTPMESRTVAGKTVYSIGYGVLFACLAPSIAREEVEELASGIIAWHGELQPATDTHLFFRDSAFADDVTKTNLSAILHQHGIRHVRSL